MRKKVDKNKKIEQYKRLKELSKSGKVTSKDKIFMREYELEKLKEQEKKEAIERKKKKIRNINRIVNVEVEKIYNETKDEIIDIKIASLFLYALENSEELFKQIDLDSYVEDNSRGSIARKGSLKNGLGENKNGDTTHI